MRLTKVSEGGRNLWVVEHDGQEGAVIRTMVTADKDASRSEVAENLLAARGTLRALAEMPPPGK